MNKTIKTIYVALFSVFITGYSIGELAAQVPLTNIISDPQTFQWTHHPVTSTNSEEYYTGVMEVGEASFTINGETLTTRAYRQAGTAYTIPGPTLKMAPGNKYILQFKNTLPYEVLSTDMNIFKDPNASNIHTHGLHISGKTPGDDVGRSFEGQRGGDFVYDIPADHMGGTFWYHAHHHGATMLQVAGGMFGLIVIDDSNDGMPVNVANMEEKQFVIGFLDASVAGTGGDTLLSGTFGSSWTVNGSVNGNFVMPPNTWQHWRVLLADVDAKPKTITVGAECEVALMSRDGVWRTAVPKALTTGSITLTGASRADLAVRCSADSSISVGNTTVANIFVDGVADTSVHPYATDGTSSWSSLRPTYLRDLRAESPSNTESVKLGARTINGQKFDHDLPTFTLSADGVEEWKLTGAQNHPFHLHIYHVQVIGDCGEYEDGEYYDTVAGNCTIRFDINPTTTSVYEGKTIMHCHILEHEDQGAMGWADVLGSAGVIGAPTFPAGSTFQDYYSLGVEVTVPNAPSSLTANTVSSSQIDLSWSDLSDNENGFTLERSTDAGVSFSFLSDIATNVTSYSDLGLLADTTYFYQVFAWNSAGSSANSNTVNTTTSSVTGGGATSTQVGSITVSTVNIGKGLKIGRAVVIVTDDQGGIVSDAVVSGEFTGTFNEIISTSTPTDSTGTTTIDTSNTAKGSVALTFCVTGITHSALNDFTAAPGDVCSSL